MSLKGGLFPTTHEPEGKLGRGSSEDDRDTPHRRPTDPARRSGQFDYVHQGRAEKGLLRAGVDGFAHTVRDRDIDEEYMALVREYPDVWTIPNLPGSPVRLDDLPWLSDTVPPFEVESLRAQAERLEAEGPDDLFELQCRNLDRHREAGMIIGMGTDSGVSVAWTTHTELRDMAGCGLTPMEVIEAENVQ